MEGDLKRTLRSLILSIRHTLEGTADAAGDLESRLNSIGIWRDRPPKPISELPHLTPEDSDARRVVEAFFKLRVEAGVSQPEAFSEFVREAAYSWANRLLTLRCLEARALIDEVILQKEVYSGRSMAHSRFVKRNPALASAEDDGLFAVLLDEFQQRSQELPGLFEAQDPAIKLRPSVSALKKVIGFLSAADDVFIAPDAFGWAYQYWNAEEKDRVFEDVRVKRLKIAGADVIPATQLYTEPYIVKFLVQNSLGAIWFRMRPQSKLPERWEYFVRCADRQPLTLKPVSEITFLDPAMGSGHFTLEAFDLFYQMYSEEGVLKTPRSICASILNNNLFGLEIDERGVQISMAALWMRARDKAPDLEHGDLHSFHRHFVAANIHLPGAGEHIEAFLKKHPEDAPLKNALELVFHGLQSVDELGALLRVEEVVQDELDRLRESTPILDVSYGDPQKWKAALIARLRDHFNTEAKAPDPVQSFFGESAGKGLGFLELLSRQYDIVAANPPYMGSGNMGTVLKQYVSRHYKAGKRDLSAAFILRCCELAATDGYVAMVTQQSWMFLRSYKDLRAIPEGDADVTVSFKGILRDTTIEALAHLGPNAFGEISGEVVNVVMFILNKHAPLPEHRLTAFRLIGPKSPEEKDALLRQAISAVAVEC